MIRWACLLLLFFSYPSAAQDVAMLMSRGAQLEASFREEEALPVYQQVLGLNPHNIVALCHCSDLSCRIGNRVADHDKKYEYFRAGYKYAQMAYKVDSTNSEANVVMAFSLARIALDQSGKERVITAKEIKRFAEQAIRYDPNNYKAYHILGRWHFEVSNLSYLERTLARWFFGALPEASLDESQHYLEKSMALRPEFLLNYFELARVWVRKGDKPRAIRLLQKMETLPDGMYDDRTVRREGLALLEKLR